MSIAQKKQLALTLSRTLRGAVADGKQLSGQEWPCHVVSVAGAIVTIAFDVQSEFTLPQVICPIAESRYVRLPVQVGDKGLAVAASARLGGVTGLGAGLAPLSEPGNLGGLVFVPLGNSAWTTIDANAVVIQAPNGAKILTDDSASEIIVDPSQVSITQGETTVVVSGGNVTINAPNNVTITVPQTTINGDLTVNGNAAVQGNLAVSENLGVAGDVTVAFSIGCAAISVAGLAAVGSLEIDGVPFTSHAHIPGAMHVGSNPVVGNSGGVAP